MAPQSSPSRPSWLPGAVILAACAAAALAVGWALGTRLWWIYMGLALAGVLGVGLAERAWAARRAPRVPRSRGKLKVIPGGKSGNFDLEKDDPVHRQRWLM